MNNREEIISAIEKAKKQSKEYALDRIIVPFKEADMIIALLKEQEPVEPNVIIDTLVCGNCGTRLERQSMVGDNILVTERFEYCPICGRKVKWE